MPISGSCAQGFERVRAAFEGNFTDRDEIGAAVAVWVEGDLVVNLWGGYADAAAPDAHGAKTPWRSVFSGIKGLTSTCVHLLADRGELDLQAPVARYWPEFGTGGQAGHHRRDGDEPPLRRDRPPHPHALGRRCDWDTVCGQIAAAEPWWEPGTAQGYHMVSFGFILGELVRRVTGRTLGQYLRTEIAEPLGIDVHIGLPRGRTPPLRRDGQQAPHPRCAGRRGRARAPGVAGRAPDGRGWRWRWASCPTTNSARNAIDRWRDAEFPATNAHVTALGMATFYNALAQEKLLSPRAHGAGPGLPGRIRHRLVLGPRVADHGWGLGYMLNQRGVSGPNRGHSATAAPAARSRSSTSNTASATAYVMNHFDATKCQRRPAQRGALRRGLLRSRRNPRLNRTSFRRFL